MTYEEEERKAIQEESRYCGTCGEDCTKLEHYTSAHNGQYFCSTITDLGSCAYKMYQKIYEEEL